MLKPVSIADSIDWSLTYFIILAVAGSLAKTTKLASLTADAALYPTVETIIP